ncbi:hypothetical protein KUTeg_002199 [Tegillarca granosa]|uniref:Pentatricopeptide repeat-containing protein n=1 Tax=Tegillarca granosa TaxID=220873 RepID=A0ABQ9FV15_TEGGR|nr:hypothetical protein KUTeg_002199 [Tegillarca granosa]
MLNGKCRTSLTSHEISSMSSLIRIRGNLKLRFFDIQYCERLIALDKRSFSSYVLFEEDKCHKCLTLRSANQRSSSGNFTRSQYYSSSSNLKLKGLKLPKTPEDIIRKRKAAWIFSGHVNNAHFVVKYYLNSDLSPEENYYRTNKIKDIKIYNALLHGWAKQGNLSKMQEVFSFMRENDVSPTLQSYAAVLECMGKSKSGRLEITDKLLHDIKMNALKSIDPDYKPYPVPETAPYTGPLIETLNEPLSPEEMVDKNPYYGVVTADDIKKKIPEQLAREKKYFITVKSVESSKELDEKTKLMEVDKLATESEYYSPKKQSLYSRFGYHVFNQYKNSDKKANGIIDTMQKLYKAYAEVDIKMFDNGNEKNLVPAFYSIYRNREYRMHEEIKPHPVLSRLFNNAKIDDIPFEVSELPMILDIIIGVFNRKGDKDLDIPQPPTEAPPLPKIEKNMNQKERYNVIKEKMKIRQQQGEMYSLWCSELYRLSIANEVVISSNADRLKFADEMIDEILDSADNPMTVRMSFIDSYRYMSFIDSYRYMSFIDNYRYMSFIDNYRYMSFIDSYRYMSFKDSYRYMSFIDSYRYMSFKDSYRYMSFIDSYRYISFIDSYRYMSFIDSYRYMSFTDSYRYMSFIDNYRYMSFIDSYRYMSFTGQLQAQVIHLYKKRILVISFVTCRKKRFVILPFHVFSLMQVLYL